MDDLQLLVDLHREAERQGPGGEAELQQALKLAAIGPDVPLTIADIGCGTGASTLALARLLNARVTAVDILPEFLSELEKKVKAAGLSDRVETLCCSMDSLPFKDEPFDVLWSEGAVYSMGFERGVRDWKRFLKPGGLLVVSEISWLTATRPEALQDHWHSVYPEIDLLSSKLRVLEQNGYSPVGHFVLPEHCWLENYYLPMQSRFSRFLDRNGNSEAARTIVEEELKEIALYEKYSTHYGYGLYIARKL